MTRKTEACYKHIFEYIKVNVLSLECKSFMTDFETAMRNALRSIYPDSLYFTCWFHLTQAAERNLAKMNTLCTLIRGNAEARMFYKKLLALPLLPADRIVDAFHKLKTLALKKFPQFRAFLTYYDRQWLQRVSVFLKIIQIFTELFLFPIRQLISIQRFLRAVGL